MMLPQAIRLAKRAAAKGDWTTDEVEVYGRLETKTYKTFLATWRPAGGVIRVVLMKNEDGWAAYLCTDVNATAADILGLVSARSAMEQVFHDGKEIWGVGQQQLRIVHANVEAWHLNRWACTLVELWAWQRSQEELVDRSASPWDAEWRRPSHADRRKAMIREMLRAEIQAACRGPDQTARWKDLAECIARMTACCSESRGKCRCYDNVLEIRKLYAHFRQVLFSLGYSAREWRIGKELLIIPPHVRFPAAWPKRIPAQFSTAADRLSCA